MLKILYPRKKLPKIYWRKGRRSRKGWFSPSPEGGKKWPALVADLVSTATAGEGFGLGLEGETHAQDVAHRLAQGLIALKVRVGVDVGMHFHVHIIPVEEVAKLVGDLDTARYFHQHPLLDGVGLPAAFVADVHEAPVFLPKKNNNGGEFRFATAYL